MRSFNAASSLHVTKAMNSSLTKAGISQRCVVFSAPSPLGSVRPHSPQLAISAQPCPEPCQNNRGGILERLLKGDLVKLQ